MFVYSQIPSSTEGRQRMHSALAKEAAAISRQIRRMKKHGQAHELPGLRVAYRDTYDRIQELNSLLADKP